MAAVQQNITYKRELLAGDIVEVRSRLLEIRDKSIRFLHEMRNAETGEIAATCEIVGVHMDRQARKSTAFARRDPQTPASKRISNRRRRDRMPRFEPKNPDYREIATDDLRAAARDDARSAFRSRGWSRARSNSTMDYSSDFTQQNGFIHAGIITAGLDNACGIAAFTLMPAATGILTVEFKTNLLAPARGERFTFRATVVKPGRTLTVCEAQGLRDA